MIQDQKEASLIMESEKSKSNNIFWVTIFTPTYNRKETIARTYESICNLIPAKWGGYEWLIVDDGSTDDTMELVRQWIEENRIAIRYYRQKNQGKHVAMNFAEKQARGKFWFTIDSDDTILPDALQKYERVWQSIPEKDRDKYCGVSARCIDSDGNIVGDKLPWQPMDVTFTDLRMKYRIEGEMLEMFRTEILRQYPFPEYDPRMRFCPEAIAWFEMAKKYKLRVVDEAVRTYYYDASVSIMRERSEKRSAANYYLWLYYVNNLSHYLFSYPLKIIKAYVGVSMDGFVAKKSAKQILHDVIGIRKIPVVILMGLGWLLAKK
jgi:glycosyltransferase involved in cell wall biosynthesis